MNTMTRQGLGIAVTLALVGCTSETPGPQNAAGDYLLQSGKNCYQAARVNCFDYDPEAGRVSLRGREPVEISGLSIPQGEAVYLPAADMAVLYQLAEQGAALSRDEDEENEAAGTDSDSGGGGFGGAGGFG